MAGHAAVKNMVDKTARRLASSAELELALPECEKGLGHIIGAPASKDLIDGVRIQALPVHADDRGYFLEVQRIGHGLAAGFPAETSQIAAAMNYAGAVKAFHYHLHQTDCWTPAVGLLQVVLIDLRPESVTFGWRNTIYVGNLRPWQLLIPPGIAHGYKVIGTGPSVLIYATDRFYNPNDEGRIAHNDPSLNYDWELQHK